MYTHDGHFCSIEELSSQNDHLLFQFMFANKSEYQNLVSGQPIPSSYESFISLLYEWFSSGRLFQFLVIKNSEVVGTMFLYNSDNKKQHLKLSAFFAPKVRGTLVIFESVVAIFSFVFNILEVNEIYFSVYEHNEHMNKIAKKIGAKKRRVFYTNKSGKENIPTG